MDLKYLAGPPTGWRHPKDWEPPKGTKLRLLSRGWTETSGIWDDTFLAWAPLLEIEPELKQRLKREEAEREAMEYPIRRARLLESYGLRRS